MALQSVSPGAVGGARMQYHLRQVLVFVDAYAMPRPEIMVGGASGKFDEFGVLTDASTRKHVAAHLGAFAEFVRLVGRGRGDQPGCFLLAQGQIGAVTALDQLRTFPRCVNLQPK